MPSHDHPVSPALRLAVLVFKAGPSDLSHLVERVADSKHASQDRDRQSLRFPRVLPPLQVLTRLFFPARPLTLSSLPCYAIRHSQLIETLTALGAAVTWSS